MREFVTAVERTNPDEVEVDEGKVFTVDERELRYYAPGDGQMAVLMAATGRHTDTGEKIKGALDFFNSVLDEDSATYVRNRLLDREDKEFGLTLVMEIMQEMMAEWSGRPTQRSSVSTQSPKTDGPNSTPPTPVSISSDSPLTVF